MSDCDIPEQAIDRREFLRVAGFCGAAAVFGGAGKLLGANDRHGSGKTSERPNIVLIMSDDMGYSDIGCYGGEISTPNLDKLAEGGLRFTQFYNTARCCPTRASLMTGLYSHQTGVGHMMDDKGLPGYKGDLNRNCVTIAEVMKAAGYSTYMAGKWHVTKHTMPEGPKHNWPLQRGFDRFFGTIHGAGSYYYPYTLTRDNKMIPPTSDDFYYTDAISDHAVKFIEEHGKHRGDNPFFMYVAYTAAHWPMHARPEDIARYKGKYKDGWGKLRQQRYERLKKMGIIDKDWEISPKDSDDWDKVKDKAWQQRRMEVYAAMVTVMDEGIERIVDEIEREGKLDNTLIFYLQDNGGCAEEAGSTGKPRPRYKGAEKLGPMEEGELLEKMIPKVTRHGRPVMIGQGVMPGPADTWVAYGREWANVSNTPFRLYKHWEHEGGISTPLIVHWPKRIKDGGALRRQVGHLIDIMATCVDVGGATYPKLYKNHKVQPMEGVSLVPAFDGKDLRRQGPIYWEHESNKAVRLGNWKLVARGDHGRRKNARWELYNMAEDRTEIHDLAREYPKRVKRMGKMWEDWAQRANVIPWIWGGKYSPENYKK